MRWILRLLPPNPPTAEEVPIWSVTGRDARAFFLIVGTLWVAALALVVYNMRQSWPRGAGELGWRSVGEFALEALAEFGGVIFAIVVVSMLLARATTILGDVLMSLYQAMVNRFVIPVIEAHKAEGRVEGRVEGRDEERAEWQAWYDRRLEERGGRGFSEPPPNGGRAE